MRLLETVSALPRVTRPGRRNVGGLTPGEWDGNLAPGATQVDPVTLRASCQPLWPESVPGQVRGKPQVRGCAGESRACGPSGQASVSPLVKGSRHGWDPACPVSKAGSGTGQVPWATPSLYFMPSGPARDRWAAPPARGDAVCALRGPLGTFFLLRRLQSDFSKQEPDLSVSGGLSREQCGRLGQK